jgi:hypothetical protein
MNPFARAVMDKSSLHPAQEKIVAFPVRQSLPPEEEARKRDFISATLAELTGGIGGYAVGPTSSASVAAAPAGQVTSKGNWPGAVAQFRNELTGGTYEPGNRDLAP